MTVLLNGLWSVAIATSAPVASGTSTVSSGLIVLNYPRLLGGDAQYLYIGRMVRYDDEVEVRVRMERYNGPALAVIGPHANVFNILAYGGVEARDKLRLRGNVAENPAVEVTLELMHQHDPTSSGAVAAAFEPGQV